VVSIPFLSNSVIVSSSSAEYTESVKVVSIFVNQATSQPTQVVAIFDKATQDVQVIDTRNTTTLTTEVKKDVYTAAEVTSIQTTLPQIATVLLQIQTEYPRLVGLTPSTLVVESLTQVQVVTAIFEISPTLNTQVVTLYNTTSGNTTVVESSPVESNIVPFYYE